MFKKYHRLLIGSALVLPIATSAWAQGIEIQESELEGKSQQCRSLAELVQDRSEPITAVSKEKIVRAINEDNKKQCRTYRDQIRTAGTDVDRATERERLTDEVDVSKEATIEGEAEVAVPKPNVDVQVPGPNVRVKKQQPEVNISQEPMEIQLEQRKPKVSVDIPEIVVHVEIPAPRVYVLRSKPNVQINNPDPQVEVSQGDPKVTVTQRDPRLDVDLDLTDDKTSPDSPDTGAETARDERAGGDTHRVGSDAEVVQSEPQVKIVEAEGEAKTSYDSGEPTLAYQRAEPQVSVNMPKKPTVEVEQSGEAEIILETPEERKQRRQQQRAASDKERTAERQAMTSDKDARSQMRAKSQEARGQRAAADDTSDERPPSGARTMTVGDLMEMDVVTSDGEDLGAPEAFIKMNGETHLVLDSGGFLGIGEKEVPVRMSNVTLRDDKLVVAAMSEEEVEAANDFEYDESRELPEDHQVQLVGN